MLAWLVGFGFGFWLGMLFCDAIVIVLGLGFHGLCWCVWIWVLWCDFGVRFFLGLVGACVLGYGLGLDCRIWACCGVGAMQVSCVFVSHGLDLGFVVCVCMWICSLAGIFVLGGWS